MSVIFSLFSNRGINPSKEFLDIKENRHWLTEFMERVEIARDAILDVAQVDIDSDLPSMDDSIEIALSDLVEAKDEIVGAELPEEFEKISLFLENELLELSKLFHENDGIEYQMYTSYVWHIYMFESNNHEFFRTLRKLKNVLHHKETIDYDFDMKINIGDVPTIFKVTNIEDYNFIYKYFKFKCSYIAMRKLVEAETDPECQKYLAITCDGLLNNHVPMKSDVVAYIARHPNVTNRVQKLYDAIIRYLANTIDEILGNK